MSEGALKKFYNSTEWAVFREQRILDFAEEHNGVFCEICGKHLVEKGDIIIHHTPIELSEENFRDVLISLNPDNTKIVCKLCHNKEHGRWCGWQNTHQYKQRSVFIVYGAPCSGKTHYVKENMQSGDIVVDIDRLYQAMTLNELYDKPDGIKSNVFSVKNHLIEDIRLRKGNFTNAWIIGGYPEKFTREKLADELGAELVFIFSEQCECYYRLSVADDYRSAHQTEWRSYIDKWFDNYTA